MRYELGIMLNERGTQVFACIFRAGAAMKRVERKRRHKTSVPKPMRKISEVVLEFAGDFINAAGTLEEKQNRLTAACSAWNMACVPPDARNRLMEGYISGYKLYNPATSDEDMLAIRDDMEKLIRNKLRLFPDIDKQILNARVVRLDENRDRIDVASTRFE